MALYAGPDALPGIPIRRAALTPRLSAPPKSKLINHESIRLIAYAPAPLRTRMKLQLQRTVQQIYSSIYLVKADWREGIVTTPTVLNFD